MLYLSEMGRSVSDFRAQNYSVLLKQKAAASGIRSCETCEHQDASSVTNGYGKDQYIGRIPGGGLSRGGKKQPQSLGTQNGRYLLGLAIYLGI
jgi:hypothetical protein